MARRKNIKLSSKILSFIVAVVLIFAIIGGIWYAAAPESFFETFGEFLAKLGIVVPNGGGAGTPAGETMKIHFVDVGQGDAIYVQFPDGKDMLIDAGDTDSEISEGLITYLNSLGTLSNGLDYLLLTHTDADHVGGMDNVLGEYAVKCVYMPNVGAKEADAERGYITTKTYREFYEAVQNEANVEVIYNEGVLHITGEGYVVDIYCPDATYYDNIKQSSSSENKNNMSPVMVIEYAGVRTLLSGDLNAETGSTQHAWSEQHFIDQMGVAKLDCDVIKAGHHGSRGSTGDNLLRFTTPEYIVVSVGAENSYGHPHDELLNRIENYNSALLSNMYRTDEKGHVVMTVGSNGEYAINTQK